MDWRNPYYADNIVRDWNKAQGMTHVSDEHIQIRRDINIRNVSVQNSSQRPICVAITTYYSGPPPVIQFCLKAGEIKDIGINSIGSPMQFIHLLDPETKLLVGPPTSFRTDCKQFVIRDGLQGWFIQPFHTPVYKG